MTNPTTPSNNIIQQYSAVVGQDFAAYSANNYVRLPNESEQTYMQRILKLHGDNAKPNEVRDKFIELVVSNKKIFSKVIKELPTLNIRDSKNVTLLSKTLDKGTPSQINKLIKEMKSKKELTKLSVVEIHESLETKLNTYNWYAVWQKKNNFDKLLESKNLVDEALGKPPRSSYNIETAKTSPDLNEDGICDNLILATVNYKMEPINAIIENLKAKNVPAPITEVALQSITYYDGAILEKLLSQGSGEELAEIILLSGLRKRNPLNTQNSDLSIVTFNNCHDLKPIILTIQPTDNLLDVALRKGRTFLIRELCDFVEKKGSPELKEYVNKWKEVHEPYLYFRGYQISIDNAKRIINKLDQKGLADLITWFGTSDESILSSALFAKDFELLHLITDVVEKKGSPELKDFVKNWKLKYFAYYQNILISKLKSKDTENYQTHEHKTGDKVLVARQKASTRDARHDAKIFLRDFLNDRFSTRHPFSNFESFINSKDVSGRTTLTIKDDDGTLHTYDFYSTKDKMICVKDNKMAIEILLEDSNLLPFKGNNIFPTLFSKDLLPNIFKGNRIEHYYYPENPGQSDRHEGNEFWDTWTTYTWKEVDAWKEYTDKIHPAMSKVAVNILSRHSPDATPKILEVGGGIGKLAERVLKESNRKVDYLLLERNEKEISDARALLGNGAKVVRSDIVEDAEFYQDVEKKVPVQPNSIDLVLGSGILTSVVLKDKQATFAALEKIHKYLKPGGYLVLSGHGSSFLDSNDFKTHGFEVLNTSMPGNESNLPLYILRKVKNV